MTPERWYRIKELTWFQNIQAEVIEYVEQLQAALTKSEPPECPDCGGWHVEAGACPAARTAIPRAEVIALLPRCWRTPFCQRVGVKWVGRTTLYCDEHGAIYLPDAPWAEFARKEGL